MWTFPSRQKVQALGNSGNQFPMVRQLGNRRIIPMFGYFLNIGPGSPESPTYVVRYRVPTVWMTVVNPISHFRMDYQSIVPSQINPYTEAVILQATVDNAIKTRYGINTGLFISKSYHSANPCYLTPLHDTHATSTISAAT